MLAFGTLDMQFPLPEAFAGASLLPFSTGGVGGGKHDVRFESNFFFKPWATDHIWKPNFSERSAYNWTLGNWNAFSLVYFINFQRWQIPWLCCLSSITSLMKHCVANGDIMLSRKPANESSAKGLSCLWRLCTPAIYYRPKYTAQSIQELIKSKSLPHQPSQTLFPPESATHIPIADQVTRRTLEAVIQCTLCTRFFVMITTLQ